MSVPTFDTLLDSLRIPSSTAISLDKLAKVLGISSKHIADAAGVHHSTIRANPESARAQAFARNVIHALETAVDLNGDTEHALFLLKNSPIRSFGYKTALELIEAGRTDDVVGYLKSLSAGYVG